MRLSDILAQETAVRALKSSISRSSVAHAYLFTGPRGSGKTTTALAFASALNCSEPTPDGDACGLCLSCTRIEAGPDADVQVISPDGNQTKMEQMHEMIRSMSYAPLSGRHKVLIIEQADTLNTSSENCILKILEEPPTYAVLILLSANPNSLLPTIRSRCMNVRFRRASIEEIAEVLRNSTEVTDEEAQVLAASSQGSIGKALRMASEPTFMEERRELFRMLTAWSEGPAVMSMQIAESIRGIAEPRKNDPDERTRVRRLTDILDHLLSWYADLLDLKVRGEDASLVNTDHTEYLRAQSELYSIDRLQTAIQTIMDTRRYMEGNITPQLALENMFLAIRP